MARKKKDNIEQNDIQVIEVVKEGVKEQEQDNKENKQNCVHSKQNKDIIVQDNVSRDTRTLEQKLNCVHNSYKRKLRKI